MTDKQETNVAALVKQQLRKLARQRGEAFDFTLSRYGAERFLYRLSQSEYCDQFVLKGAVLFQLWAGEPHRATRDIDLLGQGEISVDRFRAMFEEICRVEVPDDGLRFVPESIRAESIKE